MAADSIQDIQFLGKGYYHIVFKQPETVQTILNMNPLDLREAKAFFSPWYNGFNAEEGGKTGAKLFKITSFLLNLPLQHKSFLTNIGSQIGIPLTTEETMAARLKIQWNALN